MDLTLEQYYSFAFPSVLKSEINSQGGFYEAW